MNASPKHGRGDRPVAPTLRKRIFTGLLTLALLALGVIVTGCRQEPPPTSPPTLHLPVSASPTLSPDAIAGSVLDANGPVAGAAVRVQGTTNQTVTDAGGRFTLTGLAQGIAVTVSAWKHTYYCAKVEGVTPPASDVTLTLRLYQTNDNPQYEWVPPTGENSCFSCKPGVTQVWLDSDAHGRSATNPRFLTMYNGSDVRGNQSPPTRYGANRDYGRFPLRPDPSQPYYGPGYKLDFPDTAGNCAACHVPGAAVDTPYAVDPNAGTGVNAFGVHCDFCHKIADVRLNPQTGLPFPNMPGVLSMDIRRPFPEDKERYQLFFGTFDDDNVPQEDTNLPLLKESRFCAPCHFGVFWDTVVYNSFGEWLASPYSDPITGKTCQTCHTPAPTLVDGTPLTNAAPGKGGVERDPLTIHAHTFPGAANVELLQNAVTMTATARLEGDQVAVQVDIANDKTGHHVPTDSPLRQMILLVQATDGQGQALPLRDGPTVPAWGGVGDANKGLVLPALGPQAQVSAAEGYYAGLPGKGFAKVLMEVWTEVAPTGAYWNPTRIVSDNRLAAFATDTSTYTFAAPDDGGEITIQVRLIFRRAFKELMDQKGWDVPDVVMEQKTLILQNP